MTAPHSPDSPASATPDDNTVDLRCPHCDYNLRGLTIDRCPECGNDFDRRDLIARLSTMARAAVPWDYEKNLRSFFETSKLAIFAPRALAAGFPSMHDRKSSHRFALATSIAAIGLAALVHVVLTPNRSNGLVVAAGHAVAFFVGFGVCEYTLAGLLRLCTRPPGQTNPNDYWLGLVRYAGSYKILLAIAGTSVAAVATMPRPASPLWRPLAYVTIAAPVLWWLVAIWVMVLRRTKSKYDAPFSLMAPIVAVCIGAFAGVVSLALAILLFFALNGFD